MYWPYMFKHLVCVQICECPTTEYIYIPSRTEVYVCLKSFKDWQLHYSIHSPYFLYVYSLLTNTEMEVFFVYTVLEFSNPMVWKNPFFALHVHCTIPGRAFE